MYVYNHAILGNVYVEIKPRNRGIYVRCKNNKITMSLPDYAYLTKGIKILDMNVAKLQKAQQTFSQNPLRRLSKDETIALYKKAYTELPPRLAELAKAHGFQYKSCSIRKTKSRWGSCNAAKDICLSVYLAALPQKYIDYVILHELCHTRQMNHSPKFWAEMEAVQPDSKVLRRELRLYWQKNRFEI